MPFASTPPAEHVTGRDKRRIAAVVVAILLVLAASRRLGCGPAGRSAVQDGCITVRCRHDRRRAASPVRPGGRGQRARRPVAERSRVAQLTRPRSGWPGSGRLQQSSAAAS